MNETHTHDLQKIAKDLSRTTWVLGIAVVVLSLILAVLAPTVIALMFFQEQQKQVSSEDIANLMIRPQSEEPQ